MEVVVFLAQASGHLPKLALHPNAWLATDRSSIAGEQAQDCTSCTGTAVFGRGGRRRSARGSRAGHKHPDREPEEQEATFAWAAPIVRSFRDFILGRGTSGPATSALLGFAAVEI